MGAKHSDIIETNELLENYLLIRNINDTKFGEGILLQNKQTT